MPIYEYRCTGCSGEFEYQQRMSEDARTECETCGGALERLISLSAFHLKGSGWYKDLYSSSEKPGKGSSDGAATDASASGDSGSTGDAGDAGSTSDAGSSGDAGSTSSGGEGTSSSTSPSDSAS